MASPNTPWNDGTSDWIDQVIKVDLSSKTVVGGWKQEGAYNCEVGHSISASSTINMQRYNKASLHQL